MKIAGIIAEYNPFHNGHAYHLKESLKLVDAEYSVAVMSGNFLQRGEPALYDKWTRAEIAVKNGVDLVLEIPFAFACNSAEYFAKGSVGILNGLGCISYLSFGSESGDLSGLSATALKLAAEDPELSLAIKDEMAKGFSYPKARYEALRKSCGDDAAESLKNPNNILAVEYLKQCLMTNSAMQPITIKRYGSNYDQKSWTGEIASATAIRQKILVEDLSVDELAAVISGATIKAIRDKPNLYAMGFEDFYKLIMYEILSNDPTKLEGIFSVSEGLENRMFDFAKRSADAASLIKAIKTKRYTETRIQRILMHVLMHLTKEKMDEFTRDMSCLYARVLGLNEKGAKILSHIKKSECATIPIITNVNKETRFRPEISHLLNFDLIASDIYNLASGKSIDSNSDKVMKLYYEENAR